jgi:hypothetical protein
VIDVKLLSKIPMLSEKKQHWVALQRPLQSNIVSYDFAISSFGNP